MGVQDDMASVLAGPGRPQPRPPQVQGPVEGIVLSIGAKGVMFSIPGFDGGKFKYGPARWDKGGAVPTVGARCLVLFAVVTTDGTPGGGLNAPWVVAWWTP